MYLLFYSYIACYRFIQLSNLQKLATVLYYKEFFKYSNISNIFLFLILLYYFSDTIPVISLTDLKDIIKDPENTPERVLKIRNLKNKIDKIVEEDCWDLDDIFLEHDYADSTVFDCVVYFLAGYVCIYIIIDINVMLLKIYINEIGT